MRVRDRYDAEPAETDRHMRMRWELQHYFALRLTIACCYDAFANVPGTLANTLLVAFVATDPRAADAPDRITHRLAHTPQYDALRRQAWRALSGEYQRALCDV